MNSLGWSAKSSRVTTAFTPGSCSALDVSIEMMRAWACGLRSTRPTSWPAMWKSAPKRARPVTLSWPSGRMVRVPTIAGERSGGVVRVGAMGQPLISAAVSITAFTILSYPVHRQRLPASQ